LPPRRARAASIAGDDPEPIIETTGSLPLTAPQPTGQGRNRNVKRGRDYLS
jgi:hypothetical protein